MHENLNYDAISRREWSSFYKQKKAPLTEGELQSIKSLNDKISMQDVEDVYTPLIHLIYIYMKEYESLQLSRGLFMRQHLGMTPFIIGIAGSVAVGKSTTARLLQTLLARTFPTRNVQLITTDGFLYPNQVLKERAILDKKGFPESYDMEHLIEFLNSVKNGIRNNKAPVYSHEFYDIIPNEYEIIDRPDILIVEGINVFQLPANQQIYVSDFFDFSLYVDADPKLIEKWYLERFETLLDTAFLDPNNFYYDYAIGPREEAFKMAKDAWDNINLKNLNEYILPTRSRADAILHKTDNHLIDMIYLRKY